MKLILFILSTVGLTLASNGGNGNPSELFIAGNNQFTSQMFSEVTKLNPGQSVVLSAFSVLTPLAQLSLASEGASHDELLRAIGMPNDDTIKSAFTQISSQIRSVKGVELRTASRIYVAEGLRLNADFQRESQRVFGSDVKNVDFNKNAEAAATINRWVEDNTNNRIKDLVNPDSLSQDTASILVNAIYFKGLWKSPFKTFSTRDQDFYITKSNVVKIPTMYQRSSFEYGESKELDAKLLRMPYEGDEVSMLIILPNEIEGLAALERKLRDPSAIKTATENMYETEVEVFLPKFKIETTTNLKEVLERMNVKKVFDRDHAQLTKLLNDDRKVYVSEAIQKAFIEVNEEGSEAAAANEAIVVSYGRLITFNAKNPFYLEIQANGHRIFGGTFYSYGEGIFKLPNKILKKYEKTTPCSLV